MMIWPDVIYMTFLFIYILVEGDIRRFGFIKLSNQRIKIGRIAHEEFGITSKWCLSQDMNWMLGIKLIIFNISMRYYISKNMHSWCHRLLDWFLPCFLLVDTSGARTEYHHVIRCLGFKVRVIFRCKASS